MSTNSPLVAVVDDDPGVCRAVSSLLSYHGYRVRTFTAARDYLAQCEAMQPTCLLADIRMPELDGLALHQNARDQGLDVPTVFMTATGDVDTIVQAMKSGSTDLLAKPFMPAALITAVEDAVERSKRVRREQRSLVELWRSLAQLTPREAEVGALVASGLLNKQVAAAIGTTEKTVKVHRARVMQKLHAQSLAELVRIVDRVLTNPERRTLVVDGAEFQCPPVLDAMRRALERVPRRASIRW